MRGGRIPLVGMDRAARGTGEVTATTVLCIGIGNIQKKELLFNDQDLQLRAFIGNSISDGSRHSVLAGSVAERVRLRRG